MQTTSLSHGWAIADVVLKAISAFGTLCVLVLSLTLTARSKRADIFVEFRRRYEDINSKKKQLCLAAAGKPQKQEVLDWYSIFWGHQQDQFSFWQKGYIDDRTFRFWCLNRLAEHAENEALSWQDKAGAVGTISYKEGWAYISRDKKRFF